MRPPSPEGRPSSRAASPGVRSIPAPMMVALLLLASAHRPAPVSAQPTRAVVGTPAEDVAPEPGACLTAGIEALGPEARVLDRGGPRFLRPGGVEILRFTPPEDVDCVTVIATGRPGRTDVDAGLYTATGIELARDDEARAHALLRHCGAQGLALRVALEVASGQGEVVWAVVATRSGPEPSLGRASGSCFAGGAGVAQAMPDVGDEPTAGSDEAARAGLDRALARRGYEPLRPPVRRTLLSRQELPVGLPGEAGVCYAASAAGGEGIVDVDLLVQGPNGRVLAADDDPGPGGALIEWCAEVTGVHQVRARGLGRGGPVTVRTHVHRPRPGSGGAATPGGLEGLGAVVWSDLAGHLEARGLAVERRRWGWLASGDLWSVPTELSGGRCHAVAVVPADGGTRTLLELTLVDEVGAVLGSDAGVGQAPRVHVCPAEATQARTLVRLVGEPRPVLLVQAADADGGGEAASPPRPTSAPPGPPRAR